MTWPTATDDVAVHHYNIYSDGQKVAEVTSSETYLLEGLQAAQILLLEVSAVDGSGNESIRLTLSAQTADGGPPMWTNGTLTWQSGLNYISLSWPPAEDDVAVTGYRVIVNDQVKLETAERSALLEGLASGALYRIHVEAKDATERWSEEGLSADIPTLERAYNGFRRLSRQEYTRSVAQLFQGLYGTDDDPRLYCDVTRPATRASYCGNAPDGFDSWVRVLEGDSGAWVGTGLLGAYPEEITFRGEHELGGGFERLDQRLFDEHVGVWTSVAGNLTQMYFDTKQSRFTRVFPWSSPEGAASLAQWRRCEDELGPADESPDSLVAYTRECFERFMNAFSPRALRRPLVK